MVHAFQKKARRRIQAAGMKWSAMGRFKPTTVMFKRFQMGGIIEG